jgi:hypothetical protein
MENRFFVEAKSFIFSVVEGTFVLGVAEKRKDFSGRVRLSLGCVAWLLSMVEEVLQNPDYDDFVKYFREGSKVTIVRRGGNSSGRFLAVTVFDVGGWRGMIVFPEGRDGQGWGRVSGELSKVLDFFGSLVVYPSSGARPGKRLGKDAGLLSYAEAVRLSVGGGPRVQTTTTVAWCETEKIFSLDLEQVPFRQVVDCFALERSFFGPLGKDLADDCYAMGNFSSSPLGKDLLACSKTRVAIDDVGSMDQCGRQCRKVCSEGDHEWDFDVLGKEVGFFRKILDSVGDWLDRVCKCPMHLGRISFGLKQKLGFLGLGWLFRRLGKFRRFGVWSSYAHMRTGSRRLRCLPFTKKTKLCGLAKSKARLPPFSPRSCSRRRLLLRLV